jgi:hypothetical protein
MVYALDNSKVLEVRPDSPECDHRASNDNDVGDHQAKRHSY